MRISLRSSWFCQPRDGLRLLSRLAAAARADDLPIVSDVEFQPLSAQVKRVVETLELLGQPLSRDEKTRLEQGDRFHRRRAGDPDDPAGSRPPTAWPESKSTPRAASSRRRALPGPASFRTAGRSSW